MRKVKNARQLNSMHQTWRMAGAKLEALKEPHQEKLRTPSR